MSHSNKRPGWIIPDFWPDPRFFYAQSECLGPFRSRFSQCRVSGQPQVTTVWSCKSAAKAPREQQRSLTLRLSKMLEESKHPGDVCFLLATEGKGGDGRFAVDSLIFWCFWMFLNEEKFKDPWVENPYGPSHNNNMGKGQVQATSRARHLGCIGDPQQQMRGKNIENPSHVNLLGEKTCELTNWKKLEHAIQRIHFFHESEHPSRTKFTEFHPAINTPPSS